MYICAPKEPSDTVIICEGVMDALSYAELGYHAAANFGLAKCTAEKAGELYAKGYSRVINGFDSDLAAYKAWSQTKESWREYFEIERPNDIIKALRVSKLGDINDYLQALRAKDLSEPFGDCEACRSS
jgi:DNA primase